MPQLEFHQLDRRLENLRVRHPARQRRLIASLAETGQQTPIIVIETRAAAIWSSTATSASPHSSSWAATRWKPWCGR